MDKKDGSVEKRAGGNEGSVLMRHEEFRLLNQRLMAWHEFAFVRHRVATVLVSIALYVVSMLHAAPFLGVSANYFVIFPILFIAVAYGFPGGLIAGGLGLPANLALFALVGRSDAAPESALIAEFSGLAVGAAFGFLADYYRLLNAEARRREETEKNLRASLEQREVLYKELHHRVKNNLNNIRGIVRLMRSRSGNEEFAALATSLSSRIESMALVYDSLLPDRAETDVDPVRYLSALVSHVAAEYGPDRVDVSVSATGSDARLSIADSTTLGLIANEVVTNAIKHGLGPEPREGERLALEARFDSDAERWSLEIRQSGGAPAKPEPSSRGTGLGMKLIRSLASQLEATWSYATGGDWSFRIEGRRERRETGGGSQAPGGS